MKTRLALSFVILLAGIVLIAPAAARADLLLGFDFQTGTRIGSQGSVLQTYAANYGAGTLYMNGTNGSSWWDPQSASVYNQLNSFAGTTVNTSGTPFSTVTTGIGAIIFRQPQVSNGGTNANGFSAIFKFSMSGYKDLGISYAYQRQNNSSFNNLQWDYSVDGANWLSIGSQSATTYDSWNAQSLPAFSGLDNASTAYVRLTFSGATVNAVGKAMYMDNFQFNATAIPEPAANLLLFMGAGAFLVFRRARR